MLWKWCMKEIHDDKFCFMPMLCTSSMQQALLQPCPVAGKTAAKGSDDQAPTAKVRLTGNTYG